MRYHGREMVDYKDKNTIMFYGKKKSFFLFLFLGMIVIN